MVTIQSSFLMPAWAAGFRLQGQAGCSPKPSPRVSPAERGLGCSPEPVPPQSRGDLDAPLSLCLPGWPGDRSKKREVESLLAPQSRCGHSEGVGHFWMAMKDRGRMANAFFPGNGRRLLLLLALPWAWVRGALPSVKASGEGQGLC